jgi:5-formyltetrahydrofolate cyclo-ligase
MTHATVASAKAALRVAVRNRRKGLAVQHPEAHWFAAEVAHAPISQRFPRPAGKVAALYRAMGSELDPGPLGEWLAAEGWTLALPFVEDDDRMTFRRWAPGDPTAHDFAGLPSPKAEAELLSPDLVIAPLLAFDRFGGRLGQGAGWYDRTLAALRAQKDVLVVGLAYSGQEVARAPAEDHDQRLDAILTEAGWTLAEAPGAESPTGEPEADKDH